MPKKWKDLIDDKKTYGDDFVIDIGGDKFSLGDLRTANAESHGEVQRKLDARAAELNTQTQQLTQAQQELANLFQMFSEKSGLTIDDITKGGKITKKDAASAAASATGLDPNDPILAPVIAQITALKDGEIKTLEATVKNLQTAVGMALKVNLDDHYERQFGELSKGIPSTVKDLTLDKALKHAADNKLMDKHGRFNLSKAVDELTADARLAERDAAAEERGRKKALEGLNAGSMQRPGAQRTQLTNSPKNSDGSTKTIEQAIADAGNDPEIWNNALATATGAVQ